MSGVQPLQNAPVVYKTSYKRQGKDKDTQYS